MRKITGGTARDKGIRLLTIAPNWAARKLVRRPCRRRLGSRQPRKITSIWRDAGHTTRIYPRYLGTRRVRGPSIQPLHYQIHRGTFGYRSIVLLLTAICDHHHTLCPQVPSIIRSCAVDSRSDRYSRAGGISWQKDVYPLSLSAARHAAFAWSFVPRMCWRSHPLSIRRATTRRT